MDNITKVFFKPREEKGEGMWEITFSLANGEEKSIEIQKNEYEFLQYHFKNLIVSAELKG